MTPEELDQWRGREARRLRHEYPEEATEVIAARLAREGWTPPEPVVDPDVLAFREWLAERSYWPVSRSGIEKGDADYRIEAKAYLAGARMAREQEQEREEVLDWLTDKTSLELHWRADPEEDGAWCVHMVVGGVNDREWHLLATGETPLAALKSARSTLAKYRGEA